MASTGSVRSVRAAAAEHDEITQSEVDESLEASRWRRLATPGLVLSALTAIALICHASGWDVMTQESFKAIISRNEVFGDPQREAHPPNCMAGTMPSVAGPNLAGPKTEVNIMSYNLFWWQLFDHGQGPVGHLRINGNAATQLIMQQLKKTPYDMIGFTECEDEGWLVSHAGMAAEYQIFRDRACCMAYRKRLWDVLSRGVNYVADDARFGMRPAQWMRLRHKQTGRVVFFVNHHGPLAINSGGMCGGTAHAFNLMKVFQDHSQSGDAVVLVGDFNSDPGSVTMKLLSQKLHVVYGGWKTKTHIDYILSNVPSYTVKKKADLGGGGSDHDAVSATLLLGQGAQAADPPVVEDFTPEAPSSPPPESAGFCNKDREGRFEYGVSYSVPKGSGRLHFPGLGDQQQCCLKCRAMPRCKSFTFIQGGECWVYGALPTEKQSKQGTVSGLPMRKEEKELDYKLQEEESKEVQREESKEPEGSAAQAPDAAAPATAEAPPAAPSTAQATQPPPADEAPQVITDSSSSQEGPFLSVPQVDPVPQTAAPLPAPVPAMMSSPQSSPAFRMSMPPSPPPPQHQGVAGFFTWAHNMFHR